MNSTLFLIIFVTTIFVNTSSLNNQPKDSLEQIEQKQISENSILPFNLSWSTKSDEIKEKIKISKKHHQLNFFSNLSLTKHFLS